MKQLEKMKERHKRQEDEIEKYEKIAEAIIRTYPDMPEEAFKPGSIHTYRADFHVELETETLQEALELCEKMNPIQMIRYQDSCCSFIPMERMSEKETDDHIAGVMPYCYVLEWGRKWLKFFVEAEEYIIEVRVKVKNDPLTYVDHQRDRVYTGYGRITYRWRTDLINNSGQFTHRVRFSTGGNNETPPRFILY